MQDAPVDIEETLAAAFRHYQAGELDDADRLYAQVVAAAPSHADSLHLQGVIASQRGAQDLAVDLIGRAIAVDPAVAIYHVNLARLLKERARPEEAAIAFRRAIALIPAAETYNELGVVEQELGRLNDAIVSYRLALAIKPDFAQVWCNLGNALRDRGQFANAVASLETALRLGVDPGYAYYGLSGCWKFTEADRARVAEIEASLDTPALSDASRALLYFALGKIFDDLGRYGDAIRCFDEANRLERGRHNFSDWNFTGFVDWAIAAFPKHGTPPARGSDSERPVFIVGMPRSGTTLVEQILASHPRVAAGGELPFWLQRLDAIANHPGNAFDAAAELEATRDYLELLTSIASNAQRVTDKMPYNFLLLGLIHKLFPNARIIHCCRNPIDTALSIYFTRFSQFIPIQEFAYSRTDIVRYYRQYRRLMAHWRSVLPADRLLEIDYEALIADQEIVTRKILDFCGLDWHRACLDFHRTDRPIATASAWQARQPLYRGSIERWRHYEPWLGELIELRDV